MAKSCQCLSPKSGFFHFCCGAIKVGFLSKICQNLSLVSCFRLFRLVVLAFYTVISQTQIIVVNFYLLFRLFGLSLFCIFVAA